MTLCIKYCIMFSYKGELGIPAERRFGLDPYRPDNAGMGGIWIFGAFFVYEYSKRAFYF